MVVISGSDKGRKGKILFVDRKKSRVVIEGVNKRQKYMKPTQENPKGGALSKEFPIAISNVMLFCDKCKKGVRIGMNINDNTKTRVCKKCGKSL